MHRAVLQACLPWFAWLCVAGGVAFLLAQYCGGRPDWRRLKRLSSCEDGAIQSLSLVLTLPIYLMLVLFIVQISQIMIGIMIVNYAAFAGARAASVWIPADVATDSTFHDPPFDVDSQEEAIWVVFFNKDPKPGRPVEVRGMPPQGMLEPANILVGDIDGSALPDGGIATMTVQNGQASTKYQKIVLAATLPCLTISPSRSAGSSLTLPTEFQKTLDALTKLYPKVVADSKKQAKVSGRLRNKLTYAANFTTVDLLWQNVAHDVPDIVDGPTYNPYQHPWSGAPDWNPNEVGFRDPVTVVVRHQFALLPGIGRILATPLEPNPGSQSLSQASEDRTARRVTRRSAGDSELYTIELEASATFVNEGYKSVIRYAVQP